MNNLSNKINFLLASALSMCAFPAYAQDLPRPSIASLGIVGDPNDVKTPVKGGVVLMGGGKNVNASLRWMMERSGGGDVVILSSSLTEPNQAMFRLGRVDSVETLNIDSRAKADDEKVAQTIRNAEMVFIGGGKQSEYLRFWKNTKTMEALNYLLTEKHAPVGGSSAGCAILSNLYFSGGTGSAVSDESLKNPYNQHVSLGHGDFLHAPFLSDVITDTHYLARKRQGRHMAFLARIIQDWHVFPRGIAVDEGTAVCIDEKGHAIVQGASKAYFLLTDEAKAPEQCKPDQPLIWNRGQQAVRAYELAQSPTSSFDLANWKPELASGGKWFWWWAEKETFYQAEPTP
ncbi:cyanophycinase [bacterium]|nr:MAG: cyanophycinase [bacterium]